MNQLGTTKIGEWTKLKAHLPLSGRLAQKQRVVGDFGALVVRLQQQAKRKPRRC
jgi:hypothetical protein